MTGELGTHKELYKKHKKLLSFITRTVIASQEVTRSDVKAKYIIKKLFEAYYSNPQQLPDYILNRFFDRKGRDYTRFAIEDDRKVITQDEFFVRLICDHIGCMTDQFAAREYKKLFEPEYY